jgi:hypothetical protein
MAAEVIADQQLIPQPKETFAAPHAVATGQSWKQAFCGNAAHVGQVADAAILSSSRLIVRGV